MAKPSNTSAASQISNRDDTEVPSKALVLTILLFIVAAAVFAAFSPALSAKALMLDDDQYLVDNRLIRNPSWASAKRFLTEVRRPSTVRGYYHPLAMLSLMLDYAIAGDVDNLAPFRSTSICLHVANTLLLAILLYLLFGQPVPAAMLSLLYGLHPMNIESVAWLSQRKTLLAAFFALWCLMFYVLYVRKGSLWHLIVCMLMYVLSLLSKPSTIGIPVLLLILDFWPLQRLSKKTILEKIPLFIIAGIAAAVTFTSQKTAASVTLPAESGLMRVLLIFCHNIIFYLKTVIWPANLSWYYPFPEPFNLSHPMVAFTVIATCILIPALLISLRWTRSLAAGWLFFFVAIFPTLGLIRFHPMIAADRHMYLPVIGFLLPAAWLFSRLWSAKVIRQIILIAVVVFLAVSEFILTRHYLAYWRDTETVYKYMLDFSPNVAILHNNLGNVLKNSGKVEEAIEHFERSLQLNPDSPEVHSNLGIALSKLDRTDEAIEHYRKAIQLNPNLPAAHYNLATALAAQNKTDQAIAEYHEALRLKPDDFDSLTNLGFALAQQKKFNDAIECYKKALKLEPGDIITHGRLGLALANIGKIDEAIAQFRIVLKARPNDVEMYCNVGILLEQQGKIDQAIEQYRKALQINPDYPKARQFLQAALTKQKNR